MRRPCCAAASAAALLLLTLCARLVTAGPIMAVDLGGEFMKIALVGGAPSRGGAPVSIVINEMSRRRSASAVAWGVDGSRLLGDEAAAAAGRRPSAAITSLWALLGRNVTGGEEGASSPLSVVPTGARGAAGVRLPGKATADAAAIPAEEAAACVLTYARRLAETAAGGGVPITEAVLAVPPSATPAARAALVDAAGLAGLSVLGLISAPAAAALQYGIDRPWDAAAAPGTPGGPATIAIVDVGSVHASAALVRFSGYPKKGAASGSVGQFEVLDVAWAGEGAGSDALDTVLATRAAAAFIAAGGPDPLADPRATIRLRKAVRRTKEILSANGDAPVNVEELADGRDLRSTVTRADFEADAAAAFTAAAAPLATVLKRSKIPVSDLAAVELVGGGTRVPGVQAALRKVLGGRALDRHLDADEAVAMGTALYGANASTAVRLRPFGGGDVAVWGQSLATVGLDKSEKEVGSVSAPQPLIPFARRLPAKRVARLPLPTAKGVDGLRLTVSYDPASPNGLPADAAASGGVVGVWTVSGLGAGPEALLGKDATAAKATPRIEVHFKTAPDGRASPDRAELVAEWVEKAEAPPPPKKAPKKGKEDGNETDAAPPPPPVPKKRVARAVLTLTPADPEAAWAAPRLPAAEKAAVAARLAAADAADAASAAAAAAKNELEAYIIATRGRLESASAEEPDLVATTTPDERGSLAAACTEAEDWLYDDGEGEAAPAFTARLASLRAVGDKLFARAPNRAALPGALEAAGKAAAAAEASLAAWGKKGGPDARPYLPASEVAALKAAAAALKAKATGSAAKAALKSSPTADVSLPAAEIEAATAAVEKARAKLARVKPPPPPETPKATKKAAAKEEKAKADAPAPAPPPTPEPAAAPAPAPAPEVEAAAGDEEEGAHDEL